MRTCVPALLRWFLWSLTGATGLLLLFVGCCLLVAAWAIVFWLSLLYRSFISRLSQLYSSFIAASSQLYRTFIFSVIFGAPASSAASFV